MRLPSPSTRANYILTLTVDRQATTRRTRPASEEQKTATDPPQDSPVNDRPTRLAAAHLPPVVRPIAAGTQDLVIEADERGRVSFARAGVQPNQRPVVHVESDGSVILSPAAVVTAHEARLLQNTQLVEQIEDNRAHPKRLTKVDRKARRRLTSPSTRSPKHS